MANYSVKIYLILIIQISLLTFTIHASNELVKPKPKAKDTLDELQHTFNNITFLSIDGQPGLNEGEKYYSFYENVLYYLRLVDLANHYINQLSDTENDPDFKLTLRRKLSSIEARVSQEPFLASFISELKRTDSKASESTETNVNFEIYEDFIKNTQFGRYYAKNLTMINESIMVFNQICSHLSDLKFLGNLTRPSKQYEMVRRMSFELYLIKSELFQQISPKVLNNRDDVKRAFARLNDLAKNRPYIRMLGDQFSSSPSFFSAYVRQLTSMLDLYLTDNLTSVSFYNQLSDLPEDFITLGANIAREYERREVPLFTKFNPQYYGWPELESALKQQAQRAPNNTKQSIIKATSPGQEGASFYTRFFT